MSFIEEGEVVESAGGPFAGGKDGCKRGRRAFWDRGIQESFFFFFLFFFENLGFWRVEGGRRQINVFFWMRSLLEIWSILGGKVDEDPSNASTQRQKVIKEEFYMMNPNGTRGPQLFSVSNFAYSFRNKFITFS